MKFSFKLFLFILTIVAAVCLRGPQLQLRPMHTDEAVHAVKFGELLEKNEYHYDPNEYHGPTLNYFTLIPAWLCSSSSLKQVDEIQLRSVPVFFGLFVVIVLLMFRKELGWDTLLFAAMFTAVSPAMVFYSRYYIQEMLLVCFTIASIIFTYRFLRRPSFGKAILAGLFAGLMLATKETAILSVAAALLAFFLTSWIFSKREAIRDLNGLRKKIKYPFVYLLTMIVVAGLFYSSFLANPEGIVDSVLTFQNYFTKASQNEIHNHPWYYYFHLLLFFENGSEHFWSEGLVFILAIVGILLFYVKQELFKNRKIVQFFIFYTVILAIIYSAIPYKTPWLLLNFYQPVLFLAGIGACAALNLLKELRLKVIFGIVLAIGSVHLLWESYQLNYNFYDSPGNPYIYFHPRRDIFKIPAKLEQIAAVHPDGHELFIQVIMPENDYWPLPWYLRQFDRVGWWSQVDNTIPSASVILASPRLETDLIAKFYELPPPGQKTLYVPLFENRLELRPGVEIRGYVTMDLWNLLLQESDSSRDGT